MPIYPIYPGASSPGPNGFRTDGFESSESIDFHLGTARGLRVFKVTPEGWLTGIYYPSVWRAGENTAQHLTQSPHPEVKECGKPWGACRCGFYGYYLGSNDYAQSGDISGCVDGYGEIVLSSRGFRAKKAWIRALFIPKQFPVVSTDGGGGVLRPDHRWELEPANIAVNYPGIPIYTDFAAFERDYPAVKPEFDDGPKEAA
ncbi:hypothetical protein LWF01_02720 [Saxibacter everestensis]|uniref:Uncharacterized protein n=1 Tax=Saxibacter everestensis TaxID=2909229 RepID=A0ABY8QWV8_9MICO|nr:hypothetical protein LWF01_02720 [Brevibacteriaceae bacterium ZFBP1038]